MQENQKNLDQAIYQQKPKSVDWVWSSSINVKRLKLSILVEIGELANEMKTFKLWRNKKEVDLIRAKEELIDCLCFFLGLWNIYQIDFADYCFSPIDDKKDFNDLLLQFFSRSEKLTILKKIRKLSKKAQQTYYNWLQTFSEIALKLQMNEKEILEVYGEKNKFNKKRVIRGR